jgi:hypothetical protein
VKEKRRTQNIGSWWAWTQMGMYVHVEKLELEGARVGGGVVEWIHLAQDNNAWPRVLSTMMNLHVP